jgi:hypothetical protein
MRIRDFAAALATAAIMAGPLSAVSAPPAGAAACPDVELLFARGTDEAPPYGPMGQVFTETLRSRVADDQRSFQAYPVDYPASSEWSTAIDGITDTAEHVITTANTCPETSMVLSGFSQGAAVMGFVTSTQVPDGIDPGTVPKPLQPEIADHVSSVVLFAPPNARAMGFLGQPQFAVGPAYQAKTTQLCRSQDAVCSDGLNLDTHYHDYPGDAELIGQGVQFAASHLGLAPAPAPAEPPIHAAHGGTHGR